MTTNTPPAPQPDTPWADTRARLAAIAGLTFSGCVQFFDEQATDRDRAIAALADTHEGELEVDNAIVSTGNDNGAYVMAWVWVRFDGTDLDGTTDHD